MGFFNRLKANKVIKEYSEKSIIIFSEGNIYNTTNKPVIDELIKEVEVLYITIEKEDKLLNFTHEKFHPVYLEFDFWGQLLMATIRGKLLITTTPSLQILALKKSPNIRHYSYFMHAPVDIHSYQKNSFDYFDSIICAGDFQKESLSDLESKRNTPAKEKISLGFPYADIYKKELDKLEKVEKEYILVAPSWGDNSFLNHIDYDIFEILLQNNKKVIFRPHPMSYKYELEKIESIENKYKNNSHFIIDKNISGMKSMQQSYCMVSAISGVIMDYILFQESPVIIIDIPHRKKESLEQFDLQTISWEEKIYNEVCLKVNNKEDFIKAIETIESIDNTRIKKYREDISNFSKASTEIAKYLITKYKNI